jgi:hypothetical protein
MSRLEDALGICICYTCSDDIDVDRKNFICDACYSPSRPATQMWHCKSNGTKTMGYYCDMHGKQMEAGWAPNRLKERIMTEWHFCKKLPL